MSPEVADALARLRSSDFPADAMHAAKQYREDIELIRSTLVAQEKEIETFNRRMDAVVGYAKTLIVAAQGRMKAGS